MDRTQPGRDAGPEADPVSVARTICLRLLEQRPRTRTELATALARRGVPQSAADEVLDRFSDVGLVDDAQFARAWVTTRHAGRGLARSALRQELHRRGVAPEHVGAALEELDPDDELATARALVSRRLPATRGLTPEARTRRLVGMLARKGYPAGTAFRVVRDAVAGEGEGGALELPVDELDQLDG